MVFQQRDAPYARMSHVGVNTILQIQIREHKKGKYNIRQNMFLAHRLTAFAVVSALWPRARASGGTTEVWEAQSWGG